MFLAWEGELIAVRMVFQCRSLSYFTFAFLLHTILALVDVLDSKTNSREGTRGIFFAILFFYA